MTTVRILTAMRWSFLIIAIFSEVDGTKTMTKSDRLWFFRKSVSVDRADGACSERGGSGSDNLSDISGLF
jgi:hypothetical protein